MTARALVIGIDAADLDVVTAIGRARLPALFSLMDRGAFARLESVLPAATLPNWTTFLTGVNPGAHGVFDFTTRSGYSVRFTAGTVRAAPTIASRLDAMGLACACIGFPATWPPEKLEHGVFMSGWDAPVAFEADRSFVWPPPLYDEIVARFGAPRFDDVDEFDAGSSGWHAALAPALVARIERRVELLEWLLERRRWDLFAAYFGEADTAAHHLWSLHDERSPRRPAGVGAREQDGLARVYEALDRAVAALVTRAGSGTEVTIVSDHGSGGASDKVLYINRALADAGLATLREGRATTSVATRMKDIALTRLPARLRERVFRSFDTALPSWLESRARFGGLDMQRTIAFSDELNYFPAVHLNVRGREPLGRVRACDVARARRDVSDALLALRDPFTGAPVVAGVHAREDLFQGPYVERAPDLILELTLDAGYSYNVMPSAHAPRGAGAFRRLGPDEYLGRKGRSLPGSHRRHGLFVAAGPSVERAGELRARMADATATVLARLGVSASARGDGRALDEVILDRAAEARVATRLRALGYIE